MRADENRGRGMELHQVKGIDRPQEVCPEDWSVGRRWKFRRNLVISLAARHGCSERLLADVFDLRHSRIHAIIAEFRAKYSEGPGV